MSVDGDKPPSYGWALSPAVVLPSHPFVLLALTFEMENVKESDCQPCVRTPVSDLSGLYTTGGGLKDKCCGGRQILLALLLAAWSPPYR